MKSILEGNETLVAAHKTETSKIRVLSLRFQGIRDLEKQNKKFI